MSTFRGARPLLFVCLLSGCSPSYGLAWTVGAPSNGNVTVQVARQFVGPVSGSDVVMGLVVQGTHVRAYLAGGDSSWAKESAWFEGTLDGQHFTASSSDGKRALSGTLDALPGLATSVSGTVTLANGTPASYALKFANVGQGAGVYEKDDGTSVVDVVVTNEGHAQGVAVAKVGGAASQVLVAGVPANGCLLASVATPGGNGSRGLALGTIAAAQDCSLPPPAATKPGVTVFVDGTNGLDTKNNGSEAQPFKTIQHAITAAGDNSHVVIKPGTYRESIRIEDRTNFEIDAKTPNTVTIAGSDIYTGWTADPAHAGAFVHAWPYKLGEAPTTSALTTLGKRLELVFVSGKPLDQVASADALVANTFAVSEAEGLIRIQPKRFDIARDTVEVSVRPIMTGFASPTAHADDYLFLGRNVNGLHVTGLVFQHGNRPYANGYAAFFDKCKDVALVNCGFNHNNGVGLGLEACSGFVLTNVLCDNNGVAGLILNGSLDGSGSLVEASANNWRGAQGGVFDGGAAGMHWQQVSNVALDKLTARDNLAPGMVLDPGDRNITLGTVLSAGNRVGLQLGATSGPLTVQDAAIANNDVGVYGVDAANVILQNAVIAHNRRGQLVVTSTLGGTAVTSSTDRTAPTDWTLRGNIVAADADCKALLVEGGLDLGLDKVPAISGFDAFFEGLTVDANLYYHAGTPNAFRGPDGAALDLAGWKKLTGQDAKANFTSEAINQANLRLTAQGVLIP